MSIIQPELNFKYEQLIRKMPDIEFEPVKEIEVLEADEGLFYGDFVRGLAFSKQKNDSTVLIKCQEGDIVAISFNGLIFCLKEEQFNPKYLNKAKRMEESDFYSV